MAQVRIKRILFFAEAVTLAHVARPLTLAGGLDRERFEPVIACHTRCEPFLRTLGCEQLPLATIASDRFLRALASGSPVYDIRTLRRYLAEDLALIEQVRPDLIVGDFRLSLSVSARLVGVPYVALTNAYWSPFLQQRRMPLPVLPVTRALPLPVARFLFNVAQPLAFRLHCQPLNRLRTENGLPSLGSDLRRIYSDADSTLYADIALMFPLTTATPASHHFIGPVMWSPSVALPAWWNEIDRSRPVVYLTLGSSGRQQLSRLVIEALTELPVTVIVSTAGGSPDERPAPNAFAAVYLPGNVAAARASLVICNGGSPTSHQAIAAGVPVIGIAANMDQFMNMAALVGSGAGRLLRADRVDAQQIRSAVTATLADPAANAAAGRLQVAFAGHDAAAKFQEIATALLADPPIAQHLPSAKSVT